MDHLSRRGRRNRGFELRAEEHLAFRQRPCHKDVDRRDLGGELARELPGEPVLASRMAVACDEPPQPAERREAVGRERRFGRVIGIREDQIAEYRRLHADAHPGVRDLLKKANMSNFSIFIKKLPDGRHYLFLYFEYTGDDYEADMAALSAEPRNREWLSLCDPMQVPLAGESSWAEMESVYYNP